MEYAAGVIIAITVGVFASVVGFDKERSFYPIVLIVIATYYVLFAATAKSTHALIAEVPFVLLFAAVAALGFRRTLRVVVAGLAPMVSSTSSTPVWSATRECLRGGLASASPTT